MLFYRQLVLLFLLSFTSSYAIADDIELFVNNVQVEKYEHRLMEVKPGDILVFDEDRTQFKVIEDLGEGGTTKIFKVVQIKPKLSKIELALRIPLKAGSTLYSEVRHTTPYSDFIDLFKDGHEELRQSGVRIPSIHDYKKSQFVAVELIKVDFSLEDYLRYPEKIKGLSPQTMMEAENALYRFVESVIEYSDIGDFGIDQLTYDQKEKEWVLLDWTKYHKKIDNMYSNNGNQKHPFKYQFYSKGASKKNISRMNSIMDKIDNLYLSNSLKIRRDKKNCIVNLIRLPPMLGKLEPEILF
jgi:hypothetical protein